MRITISLPNDQGSPHIIDLPEEMARTLVSLPVEEIKKRFITENGLTIAQEEALLSLDPHETTEAMTAEEAIAFLKHRRTSHEN